MPIFISQGRYTRDAISGMVAAPEDRSKATAKLIEAAGGRLIGHYLTFGAYDFVVIAEAPDPKAMASAVLAASAGGGVADMTTTLAMDWTEAVDAFDRAGKLAGQFRSAGAK